MHWYPRTVEIDSSGPLIVGHVAWRAHLAVAGGTRCVAQTACRDTEPPAPGAVALAGRRTRLADFGRVGVVAAMGIDAAWRNVTATQRAVIDTLRVASGFRMLSTGQG